MATELVTKDDVIRSLDGLLYTNPKLSPAAMGLPLITREQWIGKVDKLAIVW
jgi:hypothetical protein